MVTGASARNATMKDMQSETPTVGKIRVDIIIACHNCGRFLPQTMESIWAQKGDFDIIDVVVVNDRSTDEQTVDILEKLREDSRVRVISNKGPKGAAAGRNTGLRESNADWVIFLDSDDLLTLGSIQERVKVLSTRPEISWIGGDITVIDADGKPEEESFFRSRPRPREFLRAAWSVDQAVIFPRPVKMFINVCVSQVGAAMIRRDLLERLGGFREELWQAEDYQLWIRMAAIADFAFLPRTLLLYRQHGNNTMDTDIPPRLWTIRAFEELLADAIFHPFRSLINKRISDFHLDNAMYFIGKYRYSRAARAHVHSFMKSPNVKAVRGLLALGARPIYAKLSGLFRP